MIKIKKDFLVLALVFLGISGTLQSQEKPNILWITCEDISPYLGCYGFEQADTPNLDKLAKMGILFTNTYSNAPVCGVARTTLLTGMYAPTTGTHNFRTNTQLPSSIPAYPKVLREAGYYCTNNYKRDYNSSFETDRTLWDVSNKNAHYKTRKPGQPFFAVFNILETHESQLAGKRIEEYVKNGDIPAKPRINLADIQLPPYHPDMPEVREDWARFHDLITLMDRKVGEFLKELKDENLDENTIIFFNSDHGGMLSRSKRYLFNVGTQVPFMVYFPKKWEHLANHPQATTNDELVSFVDFPKTLLSIAGCPIPEKMQGKIFLGKDKESSPKYVHFYRDRMSERYDFDRGITDGEYNFIRNFVPHIPNGNSTRYGYSVQQNWVANEQSFQSGNSNAIQSQFYLPKKPIELFDNKQDPWNVNSISDNPKFAEKVKELSDELDRWMIEIKDIGLIPEPMFHDLVGKGKKYTTIYEYAQSSEYEVGKILNVAKLAANGNLLDKNSFLNYLKDKNPIIRYWGAYGIFRLAQNDQSLQTCLKNAIAKETIPVNKLIAAQALAICGDKKAAFEILYNETKKARDGYVFLFGLNALQYSHTDAFLTKKDWANFKVQKFNTDDAVDKFGKEYSQRIIDDALGLFPKRRKAD